MTKFQFRLATLQKLRETHRDEMRGRLAEAYRAEQLLAEQIKSIQSEAAELQQNQRNYFQTKSSNVNQLLNVQRYQAVLRTQLTTLKSQTGMLRTEIEKRRLALVEADQQVRALEKLHERQLDEHRRQQLLAEAKEMDEIAGRRREVLS